MRLSFYQIARYGTLVATAKAQQRTRLDQGIGLRFEENGEILTWGWTSSPWVDLTRLEIRYDRTNQGPDQMRIDLAINGGVLTTVYSDLTVSTTGTDALNIDLSSFTSVTSASVRLVAFGAGNSNGKFDIENYQAGPQSGHRGILRICRSGAVQPGTRMRCHHRTWIAPPSAGFGEHLKHSAGKMRQVVRFAAGNEVPVDDDGGVFPGCPGIDQIVFDAR